MAEKMENGTDAEHRAVVRADTCAVVRAAPHADGYAEGLQKCQKCRNGLQKWFAETVQNLAQIGWAEKNGRDTDEFAVGMQKEES